MEIFNRTITVLLGSYFRLFGWAPPILGLAVLSVLAGIAMLWVLRLTSDQKRIALAKRRVVAHLLEMRLATDEPALMWRAQRDLLVANLRYIGLMLRPAAAIALPMVLLLLHMDAFYGRAPLRIGEAAIVTMQTAGVLRSEGAAPRLAVPEGIAVDTPGVRMPGARQVSWRIRPLRSAAGPLRISFNGENAEKRIVAGSAFRFVPGRRTNSALSELWYPDESRLKTRSVSWIEVEYPPAEIEFLGLHWHWLIWFTIFSMLAALVLKNRLGVVL